MINRKWAIVPTVFAAALLLLPAKGWSQDLPEGVEFQVVAEYAVDIPGVEKATLGKLSLAPGAKWENLPIENTEFCNATQGVISVVDHTLGTSNLYTPGSRWAPHKGSSVTITNPGDVTHVHWVLALIEKK